MNSVVLKYRDFPSLRPERCSCLVQLLLICDSAIVAPVFVMSTLLKFHDVGRNIIRVILCQIYIIVSVNNVSYYAYHEHNGNNHIKPV